MWLGPFLTVHFLKRAVSKAEVHLYSAKVHLFKLAASKLMDKKYGGPMIFISVDISKSLVCFFTVERFIVKEDENQSLTLSRFCRFLLSCHWKEKNGDHSICSIRTPRFDKCLIFEQPPFFIHALFRAIFHPYSERFVWTRNVGLLRKGTNMAHPNPKPKVITLQFSRTAIWLPFSARAWE